jgi:hypothetical protein
MKSISVQVLANVTGGGVLPNPCDSVDDPAWAGIFPRPVPDECQPWWAWA